MDKEQFSNRLKELEMTMKDFSTIANVPYPTIVNWGILRDGKPLPVPGWVEPLLNYYEKSKKLEYVMGEICEKIKLVK